MMYGRGKSSPVIVAGKPANKAQPDSVTAAESVERRAGAKGNANQPARTGLSAGSRVVLALASIRQAAMLDCQYPNYTAQALSKTYAVKRPHLATLFGKCKMMRNARTHPLPARREGPGADGGGQGRRSSK